MAATWHVVQADIAYAASKSMLNVFNGPSSARVVRCSRIYLFNNSPLRNASGVYNPILVQRIIAAVGNTVVQPARFNPDTPTLDPNTSCGTGQTTTSSDVFRRVIWSNESPLDFSTLGITSDQWETLIPNCLIFEAGYYDSRVEPIVCRAGQGLEIKQNGANATGQADAEIEFTNT